jgi:hypothetical protein
MDKPTQTTINNPIHPIKDMSNTLSRRFNLVVASLHHPTYGFDPVESSPGIRDHFICIHKSTNTMPKERKLVHQMSRILRTRMRILNETGSDIWPEGARNFYGAMDRLARPQIGETMILPGDEMVVILKTVWIRLLQRTWKKVCARRSEILRKRSDPRSIQERERSGAWPIDCRDLPGLRGMMGRC